MLQWLHVVQVGFLAAALLLVLVKLKQLVSYKYDLSLPPGPPARWCWQNPLPPKEYVQVSVVPRYPQEVSPLLALLVLFLLGLRNTAP